MKTKLVSLAALITIAANEFLSVDAVDDLKQKVFSCCAVTDAINEQGGYDQFFSTTSVSWNHPDYVKADDLQSEAFTSFNDLVEDMGLEPGSMTAFHDTDFSEYELQQVRYAWLMLVAEEARSRRLKVRVIA